MTVDVFIEKNPRLLLFMQTRTHVLCFLVSLMLISSFLDRMLCGFRSFSMGGWFVGYP